MTSGTGNRPTKRWVIIMGKAFHGSVPAAEAMGVKYSTFKANLHYWDTGQRGSKPSWLIELKGEDVDNKELRDAAVVRTHANAQRLYDLKYRDIQEEYDERMAKLNKDYCVLLDVNNETS